VARCRWHAGRLLVAFDGVGDRDAAAVLRGTLLVADSSTSERSTDPDEFWDHELVGLQVVTGGDTAAAGPDAGALGQVCEVLHLPGQDVLVVDRGELGELLVPFVGAIVVDVDVAAGRVVIEPPPGLLEGSEAG
jgi:16S rRNA processing protein RimM